MNRVAAGNYLSLVTNLHNCSDAIRFAGPSIRYLVRHGAQVLGSSSGTSTQKGWIESVFIVCSIDQEQRVLGNALQQMHRVTGLNRDLNKLVLSFLSEYLHVPDAEEAESIAQYAKTEWIPSPPSPGIISRGTPLSTDSP